MSLADMPPAVPSASPTPQPPVDGERPSAFALGVLLALGLHVLLQVPMAFVGAALGEMFNVRGYDQIVWMFGPAIFIGVSQWLYLLPALLVLRRKGRPRMAAGVGVMGAVTFLLNSACFGLLWLR